MSFSKAPSISSFIKIAFVLADVLSEHKCRKMKNEAEIELNLSPYRRILAYYLIDFQYFQHEFLWRNWKSSQPNEHSSGGKTHTHVNSVEMKMLWDGGEKCGRFFLQQFTILLTSYACETRKLPFLAQNSPLVLVSRRKLLSVRPCTYTKSREKMKFSNTTDDNGNFFRFRLFIEQNIDFSLCSVLQTETSTGKKTFFGGERSGKLFFSTQTVFFRAKTKTLLNCFTR